MGIGDLGGSGADPRRWRHANSDAKNCGACGNDCQGATCATGKCQPLVLATDVYYPKNLAATTNWLFYSDSNKNVWRVAKDGTSAPTIFATGALQIFKIMAAGNRVYWQSGTSRDSGRTVTTSLEDGSGQTTIMAGQTGWTTNGTALFWQLPNATACSCPKSGGGTATCTPSDWSLCATATSCACSNDGKLMKGALDGTGATVLATRNAYDGTVPENEYLAASTSAVYWRKLTTSACSGTTLRISLEIDRVPVGGGMLTSVLSWAGGGTSIYSAGSYVWVASNRTLTCGTTIAAWGRVPGAGASSPEFVVDNGILHDAMSDGANDYFLVYSGAVIDNDRLYRVPTDAASPLPTPVVVANRAGAFTVDASFVYVGENSGAGKITRILK